MSRSAKAAKSALIIMIVIFLSKTLGFVREILIASKFGSGLITDSYFIIFTVISIVTATLNSVFSTTLVPLFIDIEETKGSHIKNKFVNNILNITFCLTAIISLLLWIFAPYVIRLIATGFEGAKYELTVKLLQIVVPMIIFAAMASIYSAYLQSKEHFTISAATGFPLNLIYIVYLLMLSSTFGIKGFMVSIILAHLSTVLFQLPTAFKIGYRYKAKVDLRDDKIKKLILLTTPIIFGTILQQINLAIDRSLASTLSTGSISSLSYAHKLEDLIVGVFIYSVITVLFPMLTLESRGNNLVGFKKIMGNGITLVLLITLPVTVGGIILARPIIEVLFQRGAFDQMATERTAAAFMFYLLGLTGLGIRDILNKVFYSLQDTKTPMLAGVISVLLNIILNFILVRFMNFQGLALATSIAVTVSSIILIVGLRKKIGELGGMKLALSFIKIILATFAMGITIYLLKNRLLINQEGFGKNVLYLTLITLFGALIYFATCYTLKIHEIKYLWHKLYGRLKWMMESI